jgi:hypothetical protein
LAFVSVILLVGCASRPAQMPQRCPRALRYESLEARLLLAVDMGGDPAEGFEPVFGPGQDFAQQASFAAFEDDTPWAFGILAAESAGPTVTDVLVSPAPVRSLAVVFSDDVNVAP